MTLLFLFRKEFMITLLLIPRVQCVWWNYNRRLMSDKIQNSDKTPVFALLYSPSCVHCHGLPEKLEAYSSTNSSRNDVIFTSINCDVTGNCGRFPVDSFPTFILVIGNQQRYWPKTFDRNPETWEEMISRYSKRKMIEIRSDEELDRQVTETSQGGSTFYFEIPSENDTVYQLMQSLYRKYLIFNDTFVYKIEPTISTPKIYAYRSPVCYEEFSGKLIKSEIIAFLDEFRYSHAHRYDTREWRLENNNHRTLTYIGYHHPSYHQIEETMSVSKWFCHDVSIGWAQGTNFELALRTLRINVTELPVTVAANKEQNCISIVNQTDVVSLRRALNAQVCDSRFKNIWREALIRVKIPGTGFTIFLFSCGLGAIMLIRLYESYASKDE